MSRYLLLKGLDIGHVYISVKDSKEGLEVVSPGRPRQDLLEGEKGGTLGKKHREGGAGGIEHGILAMIAGLPSIRKSTEGPNNLVDKDLGLAGSAIGRGVRNPKDVHAPRMPD